MRSIKYMILKPLLFSMLSDPRLWCKSTPSQSHRIAISPKGTTEGNGTLHLSWPFSYVWMRTFKMYGISERCRWHVTNVIHAVVPCVMSLTAARIHKGIKTISLVTNSLKIALREWKLFVFVSCEKQWTFTTFSYSVIDCVNSWYF